MALINDYGLRWPEGYLDVEVEMDMIRLGGSFFVKGVAMGKGLFHHYRQLQKLLWPEGEDHHRWSDLMLKEILENRITVCLGARDTGKTHVALARYALTDYFVFPNDTLILISSTDLRGLELRVWGDIKDMLARAKDRYDWLPGHALDAKHGVFTDELTFDSPIRDMRRGLICIPCIGGNGEWVGLEKYVGIKQKRRRLLGDEVQFMRSAYLDTMSNLDKGDFKGVFCGNPLGQGDPLDKLSEPESGWEAMPEPTKTTVWKNRMGGVTINLVGPDSPNNDPDTKNRFPYLINRDDEDRVSRRYGQDSMQYYSQIKGVRKAGLNAHRVLTRELCERGGAFGPCIWSGEPTTKVYALDAAFGGDRAVGGFIEFGKEVGTEQTIIKVHPPHVIPVVPGSPAEDQLATGVKKDCDANGISDERVFFDAGMWATCATRLSQVVGVNVNAVNFQGSATQRPSGDGEYVYDDKLRTRRLKRCDEAFSKFVTELWWSVRLAVESKQIRELPPDVAEEFYMREWTKTYGDRFELETKDETKKRMGQSPDLADWLAIAVEGARRLGFTIERMRDPNDPASQNNDWLLRELDKYRRVVKRTELKYA